jgi:hypothetical protein
MDAPDRIARDAHVCRSWCGVRPATPAFGQLAAFIQHAGYLHFAVRNDNDYH